MANQEHTEIVRAGKEAIEDWFGTVKKPDEILDVSGADLRAVYLEGANLRDANFAGANLSEAYLAYSSWFSADLSKANLTGASLYQAKLTTTNCREAVFDGAKLNMASFYGCQLQAASFKQATLWSSTLVFSELEGADFTEADCTYCSFGGIGLIGIVGLDSVKFSSRLLVDTSTLEYSLDPTTQFPGGVRQFLLNGGVPERIVDSFPRLVSQIRFNSCFISYGEPNIGMAKRTREDLVVSGVTCWLYDLDATPGRRTWEEIGAKRSEADKFVILASAEALIRDGVLKEIEEQIDENPEKIIVVSLDRLWSQTGFQVRRGARDLKPFLMDRNWVDMTDDYQAGLPKLLKGLER